MSQAQPSRHLMLTARDAELSAAAVFDEAMNYALAHNRISPLRELRLENLGERLLHDLALEVTLDGPGAGPAAERLLVALPDLRPGDVIQQPVRQVPWHFDAKTFAGLDEAVNATLTATWSGPNGVLTAQGGMRLLARDEWWAAAPVESLAAFVTPRAKAIADLLGDASELLRRRTGDPSLPGYQAGIARAKQMAEAIYDAMRAREIRYIDPPPSFEGTGQKIRSPHEVLVDRWGTCLDLAVTYAAALELAGLHPVLALVDGHAFAGHLADEEQLPEVVLRDPRTIRTYVDSGMFLPLETTALCAGKDLSAAAASGETRQWWAAGIDKVHCLIDVACAHRRVKPMPAISIEGGVRVVEIEHGAPTLPALAPAAAVGTPEPTPARGGAPRRQEFPPRVARWRNSLLDLSLRNPLLNMRSGSTSLDLHVPNGALGRLEDQLFAGRGISIFPHDQLADIHRMQGARTAQDVEPEVLTQLLVAEDRVFGAVTEGRYVSHLRGLVRRARTVMEETGANNLYLALGVLHWDDNGRALRAPLFLLPVTLRARRGRPFTLHIEEGAYAQPNQCLIEKLRLSQQLAIPAFENPPGDDSGIDVPGALQAIRMAVIEAQLPFTVDETAHLALLQFSTLQLWQDMTDNWTSFLRNPVVRHLIETPTDSFVDPVADAPEPCDVEGRAWCPISIDGSQLEAVAWAESGRSFVLEGPPGTGKSQTITNLVANALAGGKKVLFVAEKQAALDVVKRRLDTVGLGDLCLDLHGKDQTPENLRKQLRGAMSLHHASNAESWESQRARHQGAVDTLSRYPAALHDPGGAGLSAWTARQALLSSGDGPEVEVPAATVSAPLDTEALYRSARELSSCLFDLGTGVASHPWRLSRIAAIDRERLQEAVAKVDAAVSALSSPVVVDLLNAGDHLAAPSVVTRWARALCTSGHLVPAADAQAATEPSWERAVASARRALEIVRKDAASILETFTPGVLHEVDLDALLVKAKAADGKFLKKRFRRTVAAELDSVVRSGCELDLAALTPTIEALLNLRGAGRDVTEALEALPGVTLPAEWNPVADDAQATIDLRLEAVQASARLLEALPKGAATLEGKTVPGGADLQQSEALERAWHELLDVVDASEATARAWMGDSDSLLGALTRHLPAWVADARGEAFVQLGRWIAVHEHLRALEAAGLEGVVESLSNGSIPADELETALRRGIARAALAERLSSTVLAGFDGVSRDRAISQFAASDGELRADMVGELPATIAANRSFSPHRLVGKVGELSRELTRKRGGLKIRELFAHYGPIIGELTPCIMMSPHSVARFLPPEALDIDLVVFDEASQIKVAEAVGAMGRARSTIVVGDSQQMPPTNFMSISNGEDEDEPRQPSGIPSDMESVLSEAVEARLDRLYLTWHYRSQHESLIAFSNQNYYDGRLASFPRPPEEDDQLGVTWRRVAGTFERGKERVNRVEAEAIVVEIRERLAQDADRSIGVVTFNIQQRDLIMDMLEECTDERVGAALADEDEPLFVKNLENVQGDERDVILFSLAFSPNPDTGKLPLNFGPLLQAGGERRLNVAVTRARTQVVLFSSFDPAHLDLTRSSSVGLAHLRAYMEMAQRGAENAAVLRRIGPRDRHHDEVVAELEAVGLQVRRDVGLSDFTVDIGVAASAIGPWTAVFLDGPGYAQRATVGDRECLPHGVLTEFMGWSRVFRIWLPDWLRDRDEVVSRLRQVVESPAAELPPEANPVVMTRPAFERTETQVVVKGAVRGPQSPQPDPAQEFPEFVEADDLYVGPREILDAIDFDPDARREVEEQVRDVIEHEGPIEVGRLARLVCRRFDLQRVAARRVDDITSLVTVAQLDRTALGTFAWPPDQTPKTYKSFRVPAYGTSRVLDEIAPQEIANAMIYLAQTGLGISRDDLLRETAALFGLRRVAARTRARLATVLDDAVTSGQLIPNGDDISASTPA